MNRFGCLKTNMGILFNDSLALFVISARRGVGVGACLPIIPFFAVLAFITFPSL